MFFRMLDKPVKGIFQSNISSNVSNLYGLHSSVQQEITIFLKKMS